MPEYRPFRTRYNYTAGLNFNALSGYNNKNWNWQMKYVFRAQQEKYIREFLPISFYQINGFNKSGIYKNSNGIISEKCMHKAVFATNKEYLPFYFFPKHVNRVFIGRKLHKNALNIYKELNIKPEQKILFIENKNAQYLLEYEFSIYKFDRSLFEQVSQNEFLCYSKIVPIYEKRIFNPLRAWKQAGFSINYIDNVQQFIMELNKLNAKYDFEIHD